MKTIATTILKKDGKEYNYSILVYSNCKGVIRSVEVLDLAQTSPSPYMILDLLSDIMPRKNLYVDPNLKIELSINPIYNPSDAYKGHPCLVVRSKNGFEKRYRLNHEVSDNWMTAVPVNHIRAMVAWWRVHRDEVQYPIHKWLVWSSKENLE